MLLKSQRSLKQLTSVLEKSLLYINILSEIQKCALKQERLTVKIYVGLRDVHIPEVILYHVWYSPARRTNVSLMFTFL